MESTREQLLDELLEAAHSLPDDKLVEALDFVGYLRQRSRGHTRPERGSPEALLRHAGAMRFEPGELDRLLVELEQMRELDLAPDA